MSKTADIDEVYRVSPEYKKTDGHMTGGVGIAVYMEVEKMYAEMGFVSIDIQPKLVFSLEELEYYRNSLSLGKKHHRNE